MSRFLAPVHTWLFNKILLLEKIEKEILNQSSDVLSDKHNDLVKEYGDFIPDRPLEELIDKSNIHGWLQECIRIAESRQAAFVSLHLNNENALKNIVSIYYQFGVEAARGITAHSATDAFNALNNVLLEGMPCDRVNQVLNQDDNLVRWQTTNCVHKVNWENNGTSVVNYYRFREAFTKGFVETLDKKYIYSYELAEQQLHEIRVK